MGRLMAAPVGAVVTCMFRPRWWGIEMKPEPRVLAGRAFSKGASKCKASAARRLLRRKDAANAPNAGGEQPPGRARVEPAIRRPVGRRGTVRGRNGLHRATVRASDQAGQLVAADRIGPR